MTSAPVENSKEKIAEFWNANPCGSKFSGLPMGSAEFFTAVEKHRYDLEPHIMEMADFGAAKGLRVLELGCGLGTDGVQFARHGAHYIGLDLTANATRLAKLHLDVEGESGNTSRGDAENLPFSDASFDMVYSHGVLHHTPDTPRAFAEIRRVLKPGGRATIMLYHRQSYNYLINIMLLRRLGIHLLRLPGAITMAHWLTGEDKASPASSNYPSPCLNTLRRLPDPEKLSSYTIASTGIGATEIAYPRTPCSTCLPIQRVTSQSIWRRLASPRTPPVARSTFTPVGTLM